MAKKTTLKGLQALKSAAVTKVAEEGDKLPLHENQALLALVEKELDPLFVEAEEALAEAERTIEKATKEKKAYFLTEAYLRNLQQEDGRYRTLIEEKKKLEAVINASNRREDGVTLYRAPDGSEERNALVAVSAKIAEIEGKVSMVVAGYFGVSYTEARDKVREDNRAWQARKASNG